MLLAINYAQNYASIWERPNLSGVEQLDRCIIDVSLSLGTIVSILSSSPVEIS